MLDSLPYESQSEAEFDDQYLVISASQRQIHVVEDRVNEFISKGFVDTRDLKEYVSITNIFFLSIRLMSSLRDQEYHHLSSFVSIYFNFQIDVA